MGTSMMPVRESRRGQSVKRQMTSLSMTGALIYPYSTYLHLLILLLQEIESQSQFLPLSPQVHSMGLTGDQP